MPKQFIGKLDAAQQKLLLACQNLEYSVNEKIIAAKKVTNSHSVANQNKILTDDQKQQLILQLQKEVEKLQRDNFLFIKENQELLTHITQMKAEANKIVREIKSDFAKIKSSAE